MARFTLPRDLYHGKGALEALKTINEVTLFLFSALMPNQSTGLSDLP